MHAKCLSVGVSCIDFQTKRAVWPSLGPLSKSKSWNSPALIRIGVLLMTTGDAVICFKQRNIRLTVIKALTARNCRK